MKLQVDIFNVRSKTYNSYWHRKTDNNPSHKIKHKGCRIYNTMKPVWIDHGIVS